jgi:CRISPR type III-A-associated protein Csm2
MDDVQPDPVPSDLASQLEAALGKPAAEAAASAPAPAPTAKEDRPPGPRPDRPPREARPPGEHREPRREGRGAPGGGGDKREGGERRPDRGPDRGPGDRGGDRREGGRPGGDRRPFEGPPEIEIEKLISDSLYLDNQAHAIVARMRDMDSGTKSQLRRLYNAVRRAVRAPEEERKHQFVMLRARLVYTISRHGLRSLDALQRLLLQVTRKNDAKGYERFKDLFEAIVAYSE